MTKKTGKYLVVTNHTDSLYIVAADDPDRREQSLTVEPYGQVAVLASVWAGDINLAASVATGKLSVTESDQKPAKLARMPGNLKDARDRNAAEQIVYGPLESSEVRVGARDYITAEPRDWNRAGQPINVKWLKERHRPVLQVAANWIRLLGWDQNDFLGSREKLRLIEQRITEINDLAV